MMRFAAVQSDRTAEQEPLTRRRSPVHSRMRWNVYAVYHLPVLPVDLTVHSAGRPLVQPETEPVPVERFVHSLYDGDDDHSCVWVSVVPWTGQTQAGWVAYHEYVGNGLTIPALV